MQFTSIAAAGKRTRLTTPEYFLCGALTGAVASFAEGPIDLVRISNDYIYFITSICL